MKQYRGWWFPDADEHLSSQVKADYPETYYQQNILDAALSFVKKYNTAIDIGGNVGLHAVRLSKLFSDVHTFEPVSNNYECLEKNTLGYTNIKLYKSGLGNEDSKLTIEIPVNMAINCGAYSISKFTDSDEEKITENIDVYKLDNYNLAPDFIKIDTEGFEFQVLEGAYNTLEKHKPTIVAEVAKKKPTKKVLDFLKEFGYDLVWTANSDKVFSVLTDKQRKRLIKEGKL